MRKPEQQCIADCLYGEPLDELRRIVPEACGDDLVRSILGLIHRHLKPLEDPRANTTRVGQLIARYAKVLKRRVPAKRPKTRAGALKSLEAFVTKDIRATAREYSDFEARAEKALIENPAMHLTARGIERHEQRAIDIIGRFMQVIAEQTEQLSRFRVRVQKLENEYFDRDDWSLHLHDRINRLANLLTSIDAAATSLKRAVLGQRPFTRALESLRAIRDDSLNPLEFVEKVFGGHDYPYTIRVSPPQPLRYVNHFLVREILLELVHNAIANNASVIDLRIGDVGATHATMIVEDDCPGGMPREIIERIGHERISDYRVPNTAELYGGASFSRGWGLYAVCNNMIGRLGDGASIDFASPLAPAGGTRVTMTVPVISKQRADNHQEHAPMSEPSTFTSLDAFMCSGRALGTGSLTTTMVLPAVVQNYK